MQNSEIFSETFESMQDGFLSFDSNWQLVKIAIHDDLTGVYNRYFFDVIIREHMGISDRYGGLLSMALLRIDHFRELVAQHGRAAGHDAIRLVARTVSRVIRDPDLLVRFDEDEFGILMPHTDPIGAAEAAEKIREAVAKAESPAGEPLTVSLGVAGRLKLESFRQWYRRLDKALHQARLSGPDRVAIWDRYEHLPPGSVKICWRKEWESGNPERDHQHQELVELANQLVLNGTRRRECKDVLAEISHLRQKIADHFRQEDAILAAIGYPRQAVREERHTRLLTRIDWARQACAREEVDPESFISFLRDEVILEHLMDTDEGLHYARIRI